MRNYLSSRYVYLSIFINISISKKLSIFHYIYKCINYRNNFMQTKKTDNKCIFLFIYVFRIFFPYFYRSLNSGNIVCQIFKVRNANLAKVFLGKSLIQKFFKNKKRRAYYNYFLYCHIIVPLFLAKRCS